MAFEIVSFLNSLKRKSRRERDTPNASATSETFMFFSAFAEINATARAMSEVTGEIGFADSRSSIFFAVFNMCATVGVVRRRIMRFKVSAASWPSSI